MNPFKIKEKNKPKRTNIFSRKKKNVYRKRRFKLKK